MTQNDRRVPDIRATGCKRGCYGGLSLRERHPNIGCLQCPAVVGTITAHAYTVPLRVRENKYFEFILTRKKGTIYERMCVRDTEKRDRKTCRGNKGRCGESLHQFLQAVNKLCFLIRSHSSKHCASDCQPSQFLISQITTTQYCSSRRPDV